MSFRRVFPFVLAAIAAVFFVLSCGSDKQRLVEMANTTKHVGGNAQMGSVMFPHDKHEAKDIKCTVCHHKENNPSRDKVCAECHVGDDGMNTMHKLCIDCHIASKKGPRECDGCHGPVIKRG